MSCKPNVHLGVHENGTSPDSKEYRGPTLLIDRHSIEDSPLRLVTPTPGRIHARTNSIHSWEADPRGYYTTFYNQFTSIILISTFTGGVQAAVLSFMNDLLSSTPLSIPLFNEAETDASRRVYGTYSLGLMLGLLAVSLNLTVAAIAAVNAALACHFSIHPPTSKPSMEARIVFCMIIQFIASGVAGISLVLLCYKFDLAFTIVAAFVFFGGISMSAYHLIALFGSRWFTQLRQQPLQSISLMVSTSAALVDVISPSPSSWFTISTYGMTITYHILAVLHNRSSRRNGPRRLALFGVAVIVLCWFGCVIVTALLGMRHQNHEGGWEFILRCTTAILAGIEACILGAVGATDLRAMLRWRRDNPGRGLSLSPVTVVPEKADRSQV